MGSHCRCRRAHGRRIHYSAAIRLMGETCGCELYLHCGGPEAAGCSTTFNAISVIHDWPLTGGILTRCGEFDRKWKIAKQMIGRRLSQQAKRLLAKLG
jgi:hypothetical protein